LKQLAQRTQDQWRDLIGSVGGYAPILKAQAGLDHVRTLLDQSWSASLIKDIHARMGEVIATIQTVVVPSEAPAFIAPILEQLHDIVGVLKQRLSDAKNSLGDDATELCHDMMQKVQAYVSQFAPTIHSQIHQVTDYCANNEKVKAVRNAALAVTENPVIRDQVKPELVKLKGDLTTELFSNDVLRHKVLVIALILFAFIALAVKSVAHRVHELATHKVVDLKTAAANKTEPTMTFRTTSVKDE